MLRLEVTFSSSHPVLVSSNSVDLSVVCCPSERLGSVPRREGVGGESRVNKGKVRGIKGVVEIVEVVVHLDGGELSFVNDVGRGKGTNVKAIVQATRG